MTTRTILAAIELDSTAEEIATHAAEHARDLGARLILLHVMSPTVGAPPAVGLAGALTPPDPDALARCRRTAQARLDGVADLAARKGIDVTIDVVTGEAATTICTEADRHLADMIVVGTHGRRGVRRALLGSVAESVVRHSSLPTLVVHPRATHDAA